MAQKTDYFCDICNKKKKEDDIQELDVCYDCSSKAKGLKNYELEDKQANTFATAVVTSLIWIIGLTMIYVIYVLSR